MTCLPIFFGAEFLGYPMSIRGKARSEKKEFVRAHRREALRLGAGIFLANIVPLVGAILLPTAVISAVLVHRKLDTRPMCSTE